MLPFFTAEIFWALLTVSWDVWRYGQCGHTKQTCENVSCRKCDKDAGNFASNRWLIRPISHLARRDGTTAHWSHESNVAITPPNEVQLHSFQLYHMSRVSQVVDRIKRGTPQFIVLKMCRNGTMTDIPKDEGNVQYCLFDLNPWPLYLFLAP